MIRGLVNLKLVDAAKTSTCHAVSITGSDDRVRTVAAGSAGYEGPTFASARAARRSGPKESDFATTIQRDVSPWRAAVLVEANAEGSSHSSRRADVVPTASAHISPLDAQHALAVRKSINARPGMDARVEHEGSRYAA